MGNMYTKLALYGTKNEFARTDNVFIPISEVCNGTVSLVVFVRKGEFCPSLGPTKFLDLGIYRVTFISTRAISGCCAHYLGSTHI